MELEKFFSLDRKFINYDYGIKKYRSACLSFFISNILAFCLGYNAYSSSSWTQQPSWQSDDSTPPVNSSRHSSSHKDLQEDDVSPFSPGSNNLALDLGQVFLMGDLSNQYSNSIGTQLHYTYGVSDLFSFDSSLGYSQHSNGQYSLATLLTGMRLNMSWYDKIVPYFIGGLGFYRPSYIDTTVSSSSGPSYVNAVLFGIHLGPGVDLQLSKSMFFGASLTLHEMFGTQETWANGTVFNVGGSFVSFFLHTGVTF